jgi:SAM-dependent methyltransferase
MGDAEHNGKLRAMYRALLPAKLRYLVYKWRHPEHRFGEKLSRVARNGIEQFMDSLAAEGALAGNVLEIGAGGRGANKARFCASTRNYWRSDISQWPKSSLDVFCDCTRMAFRDASLDAVICSEVLEHVPNFAQAVAELGRVVKPGGRLVLTMPFFYPLHGIDKQSYSDFWRVTPGNLKLVFGDTFELLREETTHLFSPDDAFVVGVQQLWRRK